MEKLNPTEKTIWACWETKTPREVVREAAAKGTYIKLAYQYLQYKNNWDNEIAQEWFYAEVFTWVLQLLSRKQFFKASHVLNKVNVAPNKHMMTVAYESTDPSLRDYVTEQLTKTADDLHTDIPDEWRKYLDHWHLLRLLENSFNVNGIMKQNKAFGHGKDFTIVCASDVTHFTIQKIEGFPSEWKKKIACHLFVDYFDFNLENFLDAELVWKILLEKNCAIVLKRWIMLVYSKEKNMVLERLTSEKPLLKADTNTPLADETLKKLDDLLKNWEITEEMIDDVASIESFDFTKLYVIDALRSFGYKIDSEKIDPKTTLRRFTRSELLIDVDRLLKTQNVENDFNDIISQYCIDHNLYHAMTKCVCVPVNFDVDKCITNGTSNGLELWALFKNFSYTDDTSNAAHLIYEISKHICNGNLAEYFSNNHYLVLGMLIAKNMNIFQIFDENREVKIDNKIVKWNKTFNSVLPHLYSVYQQYKNNFSSIYKDVNIYQLLSGYKGLDITKLFTYDLLQMSRSNEESMMDSNCSIEPPHFSNKQLVEKYGFEWKLNYLYYLKQNRPGSAAQSLMIEQYQKYNTISIKYLRNASNQAHLLALQNWSNAVVTSVCISFISMIGCDSGMCRNHITVANFIAHYLEHCKKMSKADVLKTVTPLMGKLLAKNENDSAAEVLDLLIQSIEYILEEKRGMKPNVELADLLEEWQIAIKFTYFHNLELPGKPLSDFATRDQWLSFLIFCDVFLYPHGFIVKMCGDFKDRILSEHIAHAILHTETENLAVRKQMEESMRSSSSRTSIDKYTEKQELNFSLLSNDLWEIMSYCHGPEDPPAALIKASAYYHSPILALLATCYEPDAVDICWAQWVMTSMNKNESKKLLSSEISDASDMILSDCQMLKIMKTALKYGYYRTLHESLLIFYHESPLCNLLKFLVKAVIDFDYGSKSTELLISFKHHLERRSSVLDKAERNHSSRFITQYFIQSVTVELLTFTLCNAFKSAWHQKEFLRIICESEVTTRFTIPCPDYFKLISCLNISMRCGVTLDLHEICLGNSMESQKKFLEVLIKTKHFTEAFNFANVAGIDKDDLLIAEWTDKYEKLLDGKTEFSLNEVTLLQFWAKCSFTLKKHNVKLETAIKFLNDNCHQISNQNIQFYFRRIILGWFEELKEGFEFKEMNKLRDNIEYDMWRAYLWSDDTEALQVLSYNTTYDYVFNLNMQTKIISQENTTTFTCKPFNLLLSEVKNEASLSSMEFSDVMLIDNQFDKWNNCFLKLLNSGLIVEAWRLYKLFKPTPEYETNLNLVNVVEVCLELAEGVIGLNEIPDNVRLFLSSSSNQFKISDSNLSDSFEELVLIPENQDSASKENIPLALRKDADILSVLEAFAVRSNCKIIKYISYYFRISLQIGWSYERVLKHNGNPLDIINCLSGHSRMPLAKTVFQAYDISSQQVMDFLSLEIITAIISSHLTKTSKQHKEFFKYTLWGYFLDSDFEMFLNLRPDGNSLLGKLILEYLCAFRKLYKSVTMPFTTDTEFSTQNPTNVDEDTDSTSEANESAFIPALKTLGRTSDNQSLKSYVSQNFLQRSKKEKKPQLDVISCTSIRISSLVKSNMKALVRNAKLSTKQINIISIELLIVAHECFSSVCDTEGIATILRTAQTLTSHLLTARSWRLMVRLLTGIARYTEMGYIFQILRDNEQFEFLLGQFNYMIGQQSDKINNFKFGLLEFLKRHCPGDIELYRLVALHFSMFAEAAEVKKKQANDLIVAVRQMALDSMKVLRKKSLPEPQWIILADNDSSRLLLETALDHCSDGAELYAKGGCLVAAREMAALAQIIALQISLLKKPPTRCLFELSREKMCSVVESYLSFMEGLVFSQAIDVTYGGWLSQWKDIVYQRVLKKDSVFVKDIATYRPDVAFYVIERYDQTKNSSTPDDLPIVELRSIFV